VTRTETIGDATLYRRGSSHHKWQGDAVSEKGGRKRALRAFPSVGPCQICGAQKSERHHRDGNTANNAPDNIHVVCRRCHMTEDGRLEQVRKSMAVLQPLGIKVAAELKKAKTLCKRGHELTIANVYINTRGARCCKQCRKIHKARYLGAMK
jgi:hypothetical protein